MVADKGSIPTREELEQGACKNPHGFGFAIIADGKIISERTMKAERSIDRFLMFRKKYPSEIAIWHARIATHGGKNEGNCHPFKVGGDDRTYLAHNGILRVPMAKDEHRSDSRVFADEVLPALGGVTALDNPYKHLMIEGWASGSKIAVLTVDPEAKSQCYIINEDAGKWDLKDIWWSNQSHIKPHYEKASWEKNNWEKTTQPFVHRPANFYRAHLWDRHLDDYVLREGWYETSLGEFAEETKDTDLLPAVVSHLSLVPELPRPDFVDLPVDSDELILTDEEYKEEYVVQCPLCGQDTDTNEDPDYCTKCNICFGCGQKRLLCMCYNGSVWTGDFGY